MCICSSKIFSIQNDSSYKISQCLFRWSNSQCRKKFRIRINFIYDFFPYSTLRLISQIINCFICRNLNAQEAVNYLINEKHIEPVSANLLTKVYDRLRDIITNNLYIVYETELLGQENEGGYYSVDESLFGHTNGTQAWLLGTVNSLNHEKFRMDFSENRDINSIKHFITKYDQKSNDICIDGWSGYNFLDQLN